MVSRYIIDNDFEKKDSLDEEVMVHVRSIVTSVAGHPVSDEDAIEFYNSYNKYYEG